MRKTILILLLILMTFVSVVGCTPSVNDPEDEKIIVGTTIIPLKTMIDAVAGDLVLVEVLVPPGASPETYEPNPGKLNTLSKAQIFFGIDLPPEEKLDVSIFTDTKFVDLAGTVSEIYPDRYFDEEQEENNDGHSHSGRDPHIWLSPRRAEVMVRTIADELKILDPKNSDKYETNAAEFIEKLDKLDKDIEQTIGSMTQKKIIVFHPSFGYFADDYGIEMLALEDEGKEATAKHLTEIVDIARAEGIKVIFAQAETAAMQPAAFARDIGGRVVILDPLSGDYINNLYDIAEKIAEAENE